MKFKSTRHFFAVFAATILFISFSTEHPTGRTGAPGDGLCTDCHGGGGGGFSGEVSLSGVPSDAIPGQVYNVTVDVEVTGGSPVRGGFQIVALRNNSDTQAGTWTNNDGNSSFRTGSGRTYFGHQPAQNFGGGSSLSWTADWEAPAINDDVTFYMVSMLGNGSGSGGDNLLINEFVTTIEVIDPIEINFINIVEVTCNGLENGSAQAMVSGGTSPYDYAWDNGDDTAVAMNLSGGSHSVTVTDDTGTQMVGMVSIPEPDEIEIEPEVIDISCFGEEDGMAELDIFGGTGSFVCDWGGSIGEGCVQEELGSGVYFVTVTDENSCENIVELEIEEPDQLIINLSSMDVTAAGNDGTAIARAEGGTAPYEFVWSNGVTSVTNPSMIDGLIVGTYSVVVTDANGCQADGSVMVSGLGCFLMITPSILDVSCYGESTGEVLLNATGISSGVTFNWSNGATTSSILGVPAGSYDVTITENASCMEVLTGLIVGQPDSLQSAVTLLVNPECSNTNNGKINLAIAGGVEGYDLLWSNGLTNDTIIVGLDTMINLPDTLTQLSVGTYAYTLTDNNGCTVLDSVILNNSDILPPTVLLQQGTIVLNDSGEAELADFSLVDAGTFDNCELGEIQFSTGAFTCDDIGIQTYDVVVFDTNGNSSSGEASIVVLEMTPPVIDCSGSAVVTSSCGTVDYPTPSATDNCDVPTVALINGLASGSLFPVGVTNVTYSATDECGNSSSCSFEVTVVDDLAATFTIVDASCSGGMGSISPDISGGTPPYTVDPTDLTNLDAGNYNVVITDSNGCAYMETVSVGQSNNNLETIIATTDVFCNGDTDGSVSIEVEGGSGDYSIDFTSGADPSALAAGLYEVVITDNSNGCQLVEAFEITEPELIEVVMLEVERDPCTGVLGNIDISVSGGVEPFMVEGDTLGNIFILTITDANGCTITENIEQMLISEILILESADIIDSDATNNGSIDLTVSGGIAPYVYSWVDSSGNVISTNEDLSDLPVGDYTVMVTDANGCIVTNTYTIDMVSSIVDLDKANEKVILYPNPSSDNVTVEFIETVPTVLSIIDAKGRVVQNVLNLNSRQKLNVTDFTSGIYIIRLQYENFVIVKPFFKM